jgi:beta-galactosidase/beta-glucuronidase
MIGKAQYNLVFEGIDTIGQVQINDDVTVNVDNMFVRYVIPFTPQDVSTVPMLFIKNRELAHHTIAD